MFTPGKKARRRLGIASIATIVTAVVAVPAIQILPAAAKSNCKSQIQSYNSYIKSEQQKIQRAQLDEEQSLLRADQAQAEITALTADLLKPMPAWQVTAANQELAFETKIFNSATHEEDVDEAIVTTAQAQLSFAEGQLETLHESC